MNVYLEDLGEPTHTLVPCWMPKPLPPRNQCTGCFAPAMDSGCQGKIDSHKTNLTTKLETGMLSIALKLMIVAFTLLGLM